MDVIESIKKDKAYLKCKLIVKTWEKEFKEKYSRTPSKFDIKEAPAKIKYSYKKYFQLKSTALESSLLICDLDEETTFAAPDPAQPGNVEVLSAAIDQTIPVLPSGQELNKLLSETNSSQSTIDISSFTENMSHKLFQNRKFALRNPRKSSLPKPLIAAEAKESINKENCEYNPNDSQEKALGEFTSNCLSSNVKSTVDISEPPQLQSSLEFMKSSAVRQLNAGWLRRATGIQSDDESVLPTDHFGIRNINIPKIEPRTFDYVENSESEGEEIDKLKPALKKKKITNSNVIKHEHISEHDTELKTKDYKLKETQSTALTTREKLNSKKKTKIVKTADGPREPPDISEYVPFAVEDIEPRHSQVTNILKGIESTATLNAKKNAVNLPISNKLENKIKSGTLNENFVKINIEKKVFVRGKKNMNYSKYKKQQWKKKKSLHDSMEFPESGKLTCFKCGEGGHMARYCRAHKGETLLPLEDCIENEIPTLEDMQHIVFQEIDQNKNLTEKLGQFIYESSQVPESFMKLLNNSSNRSDSDIRPAYSSYDKIDDNDLKVSLELFGHTSFRPGQEHAIKRILCGMSTLLVLPTGGGKSLCYQLPAYLYSKIYNKCITLVISPLVSLMEDQVLNMPEFVKAGCLHTNQAPTQRRKIIQCLKDGEINILLISPEALISGDTSNGFTGLFKSLPSIAFACIDEAHCVSHWSHNFRPSYLVICRVLREKLNVKCILGLTATASQTTIKSIINHFEIPDGITGVITNPALPDNLHLSVSFENDKDRALVSFLMSEKICTFTSIIVYCIRRDECERIAALLRSCLQEVGRKNMEVQNRKRKRMSYTAEAYHAGMSAAQRKKIQKNFMDGTLRIIVATVAFGMGINKADIRCIIHYNMPSSFESYVQEVGRAGRDSKPAVCHAFINNNNNDVNELLKHIYSNHIDRPTIRRLLGKVFVPCGCGSTQGCSTSSDSSQHCKGHEVGIPVDATVEELDLPSENISTLLCYIELHPRKYIKVLNNAYTMCKIFSYGGPQKILEATKTCQPLAMAYLMESKRDPDVIKKSLFEFNVIEVAAAIGWESGMTKFHLKNLEWLTVNDISKRSHLKVEFHTLGFRIKARGDLSSSELDSILDELHETVIFQEKARLYQLDECSRVFKSLGNYSIDNNEIDKVLAFEKSNQLKSIIRNYFQRETAFPENVDLEKRPLNEEKIVNDVRDLITSYKDCTFSGRNVAKIFQGISSPNFPALVWGRCKFWRSHLHEDFNGIIRIATQQIIQYRM